MRNQIETITQTLTTSPSFLYGTEKEHTLAGSFAQKVSGTWLVKYTLPSIDGLKDGTVLYGQGIPGPGIGNNQDTYINTNTGIFYNKSAGVWTQVFSMQTGPPGAKGDKGDTGATGANGKTILSGTSNPSNLLTGTDGDFYLNTNTYQLFGPKTAGVWGTGVTIIGLQGEQGEAGLQGETGAAGEPGDTGPGVAAGGTTGQVLSKLSNADFDTQWIDVTGAVDIHAPDGIISGLGLSVSAGEVVVAAGSWRIDDNTYQTLTDTHLLLEAADSVNNRIDLIYANATNNIALIAGSAASNPVKPSLPVNCVEVGFALVTPSGSQATPAPGANYVTQSQFTDEIGSKAQLSTGAKNNLVEAINEVNTSIGSINQENVILKIFKKSNYK
ncbi:collagen-like protein [Mucilaginibacter lutimaris]|uniref:Collagen-like protein n=1 Tax=Mucilaginibacter lutimaris TaxID=931629 RepID=A0ABW2ZGA8_9SPHI